MQIFKSIESVTEDFQGSFVTVGNFDGVHLGHQFVFRKLLSEAREAKSKALVITFDPHPKMILHPNIRPFYLITTINEKFRLIEDCGIDGVLVIPFSLDYAKVTAAEFVQEVLVKKLGIKKIIVGHDYTFGHAKKGSSDYLMYCGRRLGFGVEIVDAFKVDNDIISSTFIRTLILQGDCKKVTVLLGRHYNVAGKVVPGKGRGIGLGFPTANIEPEKELLPLAGVYAAHVDVEGKRYAAVLNIGDKPTFADSTLTFEVHLLDFLGNLKGMMLNTFFVERIRDIIKFASPEELKNQILKDVQQARFIMSRLEKE
jgi:riboflavin kinase/FMN adenylyltransferase